MRLWFWLLRLLGWSGKRKAFYINFLPVGLLLSDDERTALYGEEAMT